jgi:hypothetical protein
MNKKKILYIFLSALFIVFFVWFYLHLANIDEFEERSTSGFIEKDNNVTNFLSCREAGDCVGILLPDISKYVCVNNSLSSDIRIYLEAVNSGAIESYPDLLEQDCTCVEEKGRCEVIPIGMLPPPF